MAEKTIKERLKAPTPKLFKKIRNLGIALTAAGGAMYGLPFDLSPVLNHLAEGMMVGGIIAGVIAQTVTTEASE